MRYIKLVGLGAWLLVIIWFEDTSDWTEENLVLAKRSLLVITGLLVLSSGTMTIHAIAQVMDRRLDRIEDRQERNVAEHDNIKQRLSSVESHVTQMDKLVWGLVWGVTTCAIATIGQLGMAVINFKVKK